MATSLEKFTAQLSDGQIKEEERNRRVDEYIKDYEVDLVKNKVRKRFNKKYGIKDDDCRREQLIKEKAVLTEHDNSKILSDDLKILWKNVESARDEQNKKLIMLKDILSKIAEKVRRVNISCGDYQLFWRIRSFEQVQREARDGVKLSIQSSIFDSHRNGYKMQLTLYPNGEGDAQNSHMSLFFSILKGTSDSFLPWPFTSSITFVLLSQHPRHQQKEAFQRTTNDTKTAGNSKNRTSTSSLLFSTPNQSLDKSSKFQDLSVTFQAKSDEDNEEYLQRPVGERNKSLGFPTFISLDDLRKGKFIENDSIFIKVFVDISRI